MFLISGIKINKEKLRTVALVILLSFCISGCSFLDKNLPVREIEPVTVDGDTARTVDDAEEETAVSENLQDTGKEPKQGLHNTADADGAGTDTGYEVAEKTETESGEAASGLKVYSEEELAAAGASQSGRYAYEQLSSEEKTLYKQIYLSLSECSEAIKADTLSPETLNKVFQCVMMDHPEIFWVNGYTHIRYVRGESLEAIGFRGSYTMDSSMIALRKEVIEAKISEILSGMPGGDDYSKIKYVYEYIISHTEYDLNSEDNQNIYSVFINGRSVCQGYAKAAQLLLNRAGIRCALVTGTTLGGEAHAWNLVYSDGAYYYVDPTWGDASYKTAEGETGRLPSMTYDYLCVPSYELFRTHTPDTVVPLPECNSLRDNYYVREGAYFTMVNEGQLSGLFDSAAATGREYITVKCSDMAVYEAMRQHLLTEQRIFDYYKSDGGTVSYWENTNQYSIGFWLVNG